MVRASSPAVPATADGGIARGAVALCREAGIDPGPLLRQAGLSDIEIGREHARIASAGQVALLHLAADAIGDDLIGFHLAKTVELREAGLVYFVIASAATLDDAFGRAERYSGIANDGMRLERLCGEEIGIRFTCVGFPRHADRHQMEFWATALVRIARQVTGTRMAPSRASFAHRRRAGSAGVEAFFGCPITFGAEEDVIVYPAAMEALPLVGADPFLNEMLVGYCEEALAHRARSTGTLRAQVENAITPLLPHGRIRAMDVAGHLGMSVRTLSRRLAAEGHTYSGILDTMRADLAQRYLHEPSLTISQVAWLLGFQEVSAFTHAFRRWTGTSPSQARQRRRGGVQWDPGEHSDPMTG